MTWILRLPSCAVNVGAGQLVMQFLIYVNVFNCILKSLQVIMVFSIYVEFLEKLKDYEPCEFDHECKSGSCGYVDNLGGHICTGRLELIISMEISGVISFYPICNISKM